MRDDAERGWFGPALAASAVVPLCLVLLALSYAFGPASCFARPLLRHGTRLLAFAPAAFAVVILEPRTRPAFAVQLSTPQWIALLSALAAALAWRHLQREQPRAASEPERAPRPAAS